MSSNLALVGVNLSGAEFDPEGTYYKYPTPAEIDYEAFKGMSVIRVPVEWERLQPSLGGPLESSQLAQLDAVVDRASQDGLKVVIDLHDYGRYGGNLVGGASVSDSQFADFWHRMAQHYAGSPNVIYDLMNEPQQTDAGAWLASVNGAIDAIRHQTVGGVQSALSDQEILVSGINYDHADQWVGTDNADVIGKGIKDPINNYAFDVHQYLDSDGSGTHYDPVTATNVTDKMTGITKWARENGQKLFLGEIGVPSDQESLGALNDVIGYLNGNADVWQGVAYWAAGSLWKPFTQDGHTYPDYPFSAEPISNPSNTANDGFDDRPQQTTLDGYAHRSTFAALGFSTPTDGADVRTPVFAGTGIDGGAVRITILAADGETVAMGTVKVTGGSWTFATSTALTDGAYTVSASEQAPGDALPTTKTERITVDTTAPAAASSTLTVQAGSGPTPIGIASPSDNLSSPDKLVITVSTLPTDGAVTLADGTTRVAGGEILTAGQLGSLLFTPTPGTGGQTSTFNYTVADGAGNTSTGMVWTDVAAEPAMTETDTTSQPAMVVTSAERQASDGLSVVPPVAEAAAVAPPTPLPNRIALDPDVVYERGAFTLSGKASSAAGAQSVVISAVLGDGVRHDLGTATLDGNGHFTFSDAVGTDGQSFFQARLTDGAGAQATSADPGLALAGGLGPRQSYGREDRFDPAGLVSTSVARPNGQRFLSVENDGQSVDMRPGDVIAAHRHGGTTFIFEPGDGSCVIGGFALKGPNHDTLEIPSSEFQNFATLLRHTSDAAGGAIITAPHSGDAIQLRGLSRAELKAHADVFTFSP